MTVTFFEVKKRNTQGRFCDEGNIAHIKHLQQIEIDKLKLKDMPKINHILFQGPGINSLTETMILCTHYGLLIYEWVLVPETQKQKDERPVLADNKDFSLKISYKLSVLPDQPVIDCVSFK